MALISMSVLSSFASITTETTEQKNATVHQKTRPLTIALIGASGGVGKALLSILLKEKTVANVYAISRSPLSLDHEEQHSSKLYQLIADITDEDSLAKASQVITDDKKTLDIVLVTTGLLHNESQSISPEKALQQLNSESFIQLMRVNALGPSLVAKYFLPLISKQGRSYMGILSARVGSISDNGLGGWHSYRASKAALNMLIKNIAIEYQRKFPDFIITGLHPGTVDTALSEPFQKNVKPEKLFSPEQSAQYLLSVINNMQASDSGKCFAWDGKLIPA